MLRTNFVCNICKDAIPVVRKPDSILVHGAKERNLKNICFRSSQRQISCINRTGGLAGG